MTSNGAFHPFGRIWLDNRRGRYSPAESKVGSHPYRVGDLSKVQSRPPGFGVVLTVVLRTTGANLLTPEV